MTKAYEALIEDYGNRLSVTTRRFHLLGYGKLALMALLALSLYRLWRTGASPAAVTLSAVLFAVLACLWVVHIHVHGEMDRCQAALDIAGKYLDRITDRWEAFPDTGGEFADPEHPYGADLDIVGDHSLYQLLCVANTRHGRRRLAQDLLHPAYTAAEIHSRQQAVEELARDVEFAVLFERDALQAAGDDAVDAVAEVLSGPAPALNPVVRGLLLWVPPLATCLLVTATVLNHPGLRLLAAVVCLAQAVFWAAGYTRTSRVFSGILSAPRVFSHYASAMERIARQEFTAPLLVRLRHRLTSREEGAIPAMRELDAIVGSIQLRHSGLLYFLANVFLLWDYRCVIRLTRWKQRYGSRCRGWFQGLGELESLLSLSVLSRTREGTCLPTVAAAPGKLEAGQMGHPLLPNRDRVCNDLALDRGLVIISGSNMSGKTTFLRTVGVNLVLARAGARVCASSFCSSLFHLHSSLRIADNLGEGVSTFYAELRRIAAIIRDARERQDLFFLIDELFRGTNSEDRLFGARAVMEELARRPATGIVTTHDLSLCDLEREHPSIRNYSFSEHYVGEEMRFSYRMQPGRARTTNARYLMRQVGILED